MSAGRSTDQCGREIKEHNGLNSSLYQGSCHCGNLQFTVQCKDTPTEVSECSCSYCRMTGTQNFMNLPAESIQLSSEWTQYTDYTFGTDEKFRRFCSLCGSCVATISGDRLATVNVRMMYDDFPPQSLLVRVCDKEKLREGQQTIPAKPAECLGDNRWRYFGSCHCKAVMYQVDSPEITSANECTCTICWRNAYLWRYPLKPVLTILSGEDNLTKYQFGKRGTGHMFCKTCGVKLFNFLSDANAPLSPVNVRTLENIDLATLQHKPQDIEVQLPDGNVVRRSLGDGRDS